MGRAVPLNTQGVRTDANSVDAAIIVEDGNLLLVRRRVSEGQLSWQFPAGEVEPGETDEEAAVRVADEETGLTVRATKSLGSRVHPNTGRTIAYIACDRVSGDTYVADEEELAGVVWCDHARLT